MASLSSRQKVNNNFELKKKPQRTKNQIQKKKMLNQNQTPISNVPISKGKKKHLIFLTAI